MGDAVCEGCGRGINFKAHPTGRQGRCPACGTEVRSPATLDDLRVDLEEIRRRLDRQGVYFGRIFWALVVGIVLVLLSLNNLTVTIRPIGR